MSRHSAAILLLPLLRQVLEGPHAVELVGELDDDDADVPRHGEEHLADRLGRLNGLVLRLERRQARSVLDEEGHAAAEALADERDEGRAAGRRGLGPGALHRCGFMLRADGGGGSFGLDLLESFLLLGLDPLGVTVEGVVEEASDHRIRVEPEIEENVGDAQVVSPGFLARGPEPPRVPFLGPREGGGDAPGVVVRVYPSRAREKAAP